MVVVEDVHRGHPVGVEIASALLERLSLGVVLEQRHRLHQIPDDDQIAPDARVQRDDVPVVRALQRELARGRGGRTVRVGTHRAGAETFFPFSSPGGFGFVRLGGVDFAPLEHLYFAVDAGDELPSQRVEVVHGARGSLLRDERQLPLARLEHQNPPFARLHLLRELEGGPDDVVLARIVREGARDDGRVALVPLQRVAIRRLERRRVDQADPARLLARLRVGGLRQNRERPGARLVRDPSRLLVKRHGPNVELLDVVDGADGEPRLGGQREGVREAPRVEGTREQNLARVDARKRQLAVRAGNHRRAVRAREDVRRALVRERAERDRPSPERNPLVLAEDAVLPEVKTQELTVAEPDERVRRAPELREQRRPRNRRRRRRAGKKLERPRA